MAGMVPCSLEMMLPQQQLSVCDLKTLRDPRDPFRKSTRSNYFNNNNNIFAYSVFFFLLSTDSVKGMVYQISDALTKNYYSPLPIFKSVFLEMLLKKQSK